MKDYNSENHQPSALPPGYIETPMGISLLDEADEEQWLCSPLRVVAMGALPDKSRWGLLVEIVDPSGKKHRVYVPMNMTAAGATSLLQSKGLRLSASVKSAARRLHTLITSWDVRNDYRFLDGLGWCDSDFDTFAVGPNEIIGSKPAFFVGARSRQSLEGTAGSLELWKSSVAKLCVGNPVLTLAVSVALSGPFVRLFGMNSFVVHLRGSSSSGKTTALFAASSVWSSPRDIKTWRTTANALESVAAAANDTFLALDEIGEISGKEAFEASYMLGNGIGKQRARSEGGLHDAATWSLSCLSSGEISLAEKVAESGKGIKTGQEVRFIDVESDGRLYGAFDCLHECGSGSELSIKLKQEASQNYGHAGRALVKILATKLNAEKRSKVGKLVEKHYEAIAACARSTLDGPAERVARTLALVATAGEVSTILKVTGWPNGDALQASKVVFGHWLARRQMPIMQACTELARYLKPRMGKMERISVGPIVPDRIGYIDDDFLYLSKEVLHQVFERNRVASVKKLLVDQNVMSKQGKHLMVKMPRSVPNRERHYKISRKKLAEFTEPGTED